MGRAQDDLRAINLRESFSAHPQLISVDRAISSVKLSLRRTSLLLVKEYTKQEVSA